MSTQHNTEGDAGPCDWCRQPVSVEPPFDCINPMHATPPAPPASTEEQA